MPRQPKATMATASGWGGPTGSRPTAVPPSLGATQARQYGRSRIGGVQSARQPKRCASPRLNLTHRPLSRLTLTANVRCPRAGMLSADCQCAACVGAFSPRGRKPRASADKAIDAAGRRRLREELEMGSPATPRLPAIGTSPGSGGRQPQQHQTSPASGRRGTPRRASQARASGLQLELDDDADADGRSPQPPPPSGNGSARSTGSAKKQDLSSKLQDLYEGSHASYSPRTMAIYSDRQQALRADPVSLQAICRCL